MREIKFRAWDKTEERFWYFDLNEVLKRQYQPIIDFINA